MDPKSAHHLRKTPSSASEARAEAHGHAHLELKGKGSARGLTKAERSAIDRSPAERAEGRRGSVRG
jgi:hypothetical protein